MLPQVYSVELSMAMCEVKQRYQIQRRNPLEKWLLSKIENCAQFIGRYHPDR